MTRKLGAVMAAALALSACEKSKPAPAPEPSQASGHATQEHAHAAPHGGTVASTARGHLELLAGHDGAFKLYLLDEQLAPLPVTGATGTLKLTVPGYADVKLSPEGDALVGKGAPFQADHATAVVSVTSGGATQTARFALHLEPGGHGGSDAVLGTVSSKPCPEDGSLASACVDGKLFLFTKLGESSPRVLVPGPGVSLAKLAPHVGRKASLSGKPLEGEPARLEVAAILPEHDHTPLHGGTVLMVGDLHLEVLALKQGEVHVYLTDAFRRPVPLEGHRGTVELATPSGPRGVPLTPEPGGAFLTAKFGAFTQPQVEATLRLPVEGDPDYFITALLDTGTAPAAQPTATVTADAQSVRLEVQGGYSPNRLVLKKGVPVHLTVLRKDTSDCSRELRIPAFGVQQELTPLKETVVTFTPTKAGTFTFTCGMDMLRGILVVEG